MLINQLGILEEGFVPRISWNPLLKYEGTSQLPSYSFQVGRCDYSEASGMALITGVLWFAAFTRNDSGIARTILIYGFPPKLANREPMFGAGALGGVGAVIVNAVGTNNMQAIKILIPGTSGNGFTDWNSSQATSSSRLQFSVLAEVQ